MTYSRCRTSVLWDKSTIPKAFCLVEVSYLHCVRVSLLHHNQTDTRTHRLAPGSHFRLERSSSLDGWWLLLHLRERITIRHGELAVARVCSAQRSAQAPLVGFDGFLFAARPASWRQPCGLQHEYCLGRCAVHASQGLDSQGSSLDPAPSSSSAGRRRYGRSALSIRMGISNYSWYIGFQGADQ